MVVKFRYLLQLMVACALRLRVKPAVKDWAGNILEAKTYDVQIDPWQKQVMRSEKTGIYVYADERNTEELFVSGV